MSLFLAADPYTEGATMRYPSIPPEADREPTDNFTDEDPFPASYEDLTAWHWVYAFCIIAVLLAIWLKGQFVR